MTATPRTPSAHAEVEAWLLGADDARVSTLAALCAVIEAADSRLVGEIKWNAPSYRIVDHFATTGLERKGGVRLVLHRGSAKRAEPLSLRSKIEDSAGLLTWRDPDRGVALFDSPQQVEAHREALLAIVRQWIALTQEPL